MTDNEFINEIAPIVQKYAKAYDYDVVSAIIAQACLESAFGRSTLGYKYHNYFGMKAGSGWTGRSVNLQTKEEYTPGTLTTIRDAFRVYSNMDEGVKGYFEFIQYPRYANLRFATTPEEYLTMIRSDGYATSTNYVANNMRIVDNYNLRRFDAPEPIKQVSYAAVVTASALNVRQGPGTDYQIVMSGGSKLVLPNGMVIAICAECAGFGRLADIEGWVSLNYIRKG